MAHALVINSDRKDTYVYQLLKQTQNVFTSRFNENNEEGENIEDSSTTSSDSSDASDSSDSSDSSTSETRLDVEKPTEKPNSLNDVVVEDEPTDEDILVPSDTKTNRAMKFLTKLAIIYHGSGAPISHFELFLSEISNLLEIKAHWTGLPTVIMVTFGDLLSNDVISKSIPSKQSFGPFGKLHDVQLLMEQVLHKKITLDEASQRLDEIEVQSPIFKPIPRLMSYAINSATAAPLYFGAGWVEILASFAFGLYVGLLDYWGDTHSNFALLSVFVQTIVVAFFSTIMYTYIDGLCYSGLLMSGILWLLPGISITLSIHELAAGNIISGSTRLFNAMFSTVKIGFGILLGSRLAFWVKTPNFLPCTPYFSHWYDFIWLILNCITFAILLDIDLHFWPGAIACGGVGYGISYWLSATFNVEGDVIAVISAFSVGAVGNGLSRLTKVSALIYIFSGLVMLVPGSMGVKGASLLISQNYDAGISFVVSMLITGLCITIGCYASSILVLPRAYLLFN